METRDFLQRYRLSLGRNGLPVELHRTPYGTTYRGHEISSGREVAIELIPFAPTSAEATARMEQAARAAQQINQPNIPALRDFGFEEGQLVYVTDSFDGHTAESWVAARGPLPLGAVLRVALQVAAALGAASFHRLQHPAINPANILFVPGQTAEGEWPAIKVLHWLGPQNAIAEGADARADTAARFASPEQLQGGEVDFASSIFSLGCTMWFLLSGTPPAMPGAPGVRASLATLRGVPKIVRHLLGRMLRVDPAERPQDPVVLQAYLQTCLARVERRDTVSRRFGIPLRAGLARAAAARPTWNRRRSQALALAALLLLLGTLAVVALPGMLRSHRTATRTTTAEPAVAPPVFADDQSPNEKLTEPAPPAEGPQRVVAAESPAEEETPAPTAMAAAAKPSPGFSEPAKVVAAATPLPREEETAAEESANTAETSLPPALAAQDESAPAAEETPEPSPVATPRARIAASSKKTSTRKPAEVAERTKKSTTTRKKSRRVAHAEVRRGRRIPQLRVGSDRAELVGTTSDGRWILSVKSSGERIVVPPPPGYGPSASR